MDSIPISALLFAAILLPGCSGDPSAEASDFSETASEYSADQFVGTWISKAEMPEAELERMRETWSDEEIKDSLEGMHWLEPTIELFKDGTAIMSHPMLESPIKDTWTLDGDTLTLASSYVALSHIGIVSKNDRSFIPNRAQHIDWPFELGVKAGGTELVTDGLYGITIVYTKE